MNRPRDAPACGPARHRYSLRTPQTASPRRATGARVSAVHERLAFSIITRYELLRGLKAKQARAQEAAFTLLCQASLILPLTDQVVERAATLYGDLHRQGALLPDADLLIAATALDAQRTLVTNNLAHFQRIPHLVIETWKR